VGRSTTTFVSHTAGRAIEVPSFGFWGDCALHQVEAGEVKLCMLSVGLFAMAVAPFAVSSALSRESRNAAGTRTGTTISGNAIGQLSNRQGRW
jgi:hypothetical protein